MAEQGLVSWDRIFYASIALVVLALATGIFSNTLSFVIWILLISFWSEIPGFININLNELNISEFLIVLLAIHFGGLKIGLVAAVYCMLMPIFSRMWRPTFSIKAGISSFIAFGTSPLFYFYVYNQNLLWTMFTYTAILFGVHGLLSLFIAAGEFFEELKTGVISLLLAYLTNVIYVYALQGWGMGLFRPTPHFPFMYKMIIIALMLAIGGVAFVNRQKKN